MAEDEQSEAFLKTIKFKIKQRGGHRTQVTKFVAEVDSFWQKKISNQPLGDTSNLTILRGKLQKLENVLETFDNEIGPYISEADQDKDAPLCLEYRDSVWDAIEKISILLAPPDPQHAVSVDGESVVSQKARKGSKLPKLQLPKFEGDPTKWHEFWDSFKNAIHENEELSDIEKFQHLKFLLRGDAQPVIDGYRLTEANYSAVISVLKERFGSDELAIFAHFDKLLALPTSGNETQVLQATYDQTEKHIRSLVSLGLAEENFGMVFTPIILSKLPRQVRTELHRKNGSDKWELSKLRELFREELKARQMGDWSLEQDHRDKKGKQGTGTGVPGGSGKPPKFPPTTGSLLQSGKAKAPKNVQCHFCTQNHFSDSCPNVTSLSARREMLKGCCYKCMWKGHTAAQCKRSKPCFHCKSPQHHQSICPVKHGSDSGQKPDTSPSLTVTGGIPPPQPTSGSTDCPPTMPGFAAGSNANESTGSKGPTVAGFSSADSTGFVHMQMALVQSGPKCISLRVFFDIGSSRTYVTSAAAKQLGLATMGHETLSNARFEDFQRRTRSYRKVDLPLTAGGNTVVVSALVTDTIACAITRVPLSIEQYPVLSHMPLADPLPTQREDVPIDVLIGSDFYYDIITHERIDLPHGLILLGSKFGYVTAGRVKGPPNTSGTFVASLLNFSGMSNVAYQNDFVEKFWTLEDIGIKDDSYLKDDELALDRFNSAVRFVDGRYEVGWPYKTLNPDLPDNFGTAFARLAWLLRRLRGQPEMVGTYSKILGDWVAKGITEVINRDRTADGLIHYLPHHFVLRPGHTTDFRIVHDASSKSRRSDLSLNDCLLRGPVFLQDLCGLLLRFRTRRFAIIADIEKAFLQLSLRVKDRDVTRFLWVKDVSKPLSEDNLIIFRFQRVLFGVISSPFLLNATIRHFLTASNDPIASLIRDDIYVDNIITGAESSEDCAKIYGFVKQIFGDNSMNVREWQTNSEEFLKSLPDSEKCTVSTRVLGLKWDPPTDSMSIAVPSLGDSAVSSKRQLLSAASKVFDPCGFFSPAIMQGKALVQQLWKRKVNKWDGAVPEDVVNEWKDVSVSLNSLDSIPIPRFIGKSASGQWVIHCFCDASAKAYAAAVYIQPSGQEIPPTLLFSKCKLAPIKPVTIPRLELMGVVAGIRLCGFVEKEIRLDICEVTVWTDSKCVLHWLSSQKVLSVFVENRVREIRKTGYAFRHVPTDFNPADIGSRGMNAEGLASNRLWWHGPEFLLAPKDSWPETDLGDSASATAEIFVASSNDQPVLEDVPVIDFSRFSSFTKLVRSFAYVLRFIKIVRAKKPGLHLAFSKLCLSGAEIAEANNTLIRLAQSGLKDQLKPSASKSSRNLFRQLGVFIDENGLLRCSGRIQQANVSESYKFPFLLPKSGSLTTLIIQHYHEKAMHAGPRHTLGLLRHKFWIPSGGQAVRSVTSKCLNCRKVDGGPYPMPPFAQLPQYRINADQPFSHVGIDYLGPLYVVDSEADKPGAKKAWVCLFTCAATRAIHLELCIDMTTDQFLLAFRRFCALYGTPKIVVSDNGKQFVLAEKVIKQLWQEVLNSSEVQDFSSKNGVSWVFIPEYAPWMGGFYERLVGSVKKALKRTLGRCRVSREVLQTVLAETSSVLNTRPLVASNELNDTVLTPAHLLGRFQLLPGEGTTTKFDLITDTPTGDSRDPGFTPRPWSGDKAIKMWKDTTKLVQEFWDIWKTDYLTQLREMKASQVNRNKADAAPQVRSVVLIKSNLPRGRWSMGLIEKLHMSSDGKCRSVTLRLANGRNVKRPVSILYPIEGEVSENTESLPHSQNSSQTVSNPRPRRAAAERAEQRIKALAEYSTVTVSLINFTVSESNSMAPQLIKITRHHKLSRLFNGHQFILNGYTFRSVEVATWYSVLSFHQCEQSAAELARHRGLNRNAEGTVAWVKQIGFDDQAIPECVTNMDRWYNLVLEESMKTAGNPIIAEFSELKAKYGDTELRFVCCSRNDFVYSCGLQDTDPKVNDAANWRGFNIYGDVLAQLYYNWYHANPSPETLKLHNLLSGREVIDRHHRRIALILSDSMTRQVKSIRFAELMPPVTGATYSTLAAVIADKRIRLEDYAYIVIICGVNQSGVSWNPLRWQRDWAPLERKLSRVLRQGSKTRVLMHSPIWHTSSKSMRAAEHSLWMREQLMNTPNITYYDWTYTVGNPFVAGQGADMHPVRNMYARDGWHVNHRGWTELWNRMATDYSSLQFLQLDFDSRLYPEVGQRDSVNSHIQMH